jgi:murein DD-endopeptidase MepM/ murein hydrolase activator NlpD
VYPVPSNARWRSALSQPHAALGLVMAVCVSVSACSADVTRFDFPVFNVAENNAPTGALPGSTGYAQPPGQSFDVPPGASQRGVGSPNQPPAPIYGGGYPGGRVAGMRELAPQTTTLPPIVPEHRPAPQPEPSYGAERMRPGLAPEAAAGRAASAPREASPPMKGAGGSPDSIEVAHGDSLYGISKRYGVALADLIEANGLHHGASLKPGQQIVLPPGTVARQQRREARARPSVALVPVTKLAPPSAVETNPGAREPDSPPAQPAMPSQPPAPAVAGDWEGSHTIKSGESLYGIARQHGVSLGELLRVNGIDNPLRVKIGTPLKVPAAAAAPPPARELAADVPPTPKIINAPTERKQFAARSDQASDAEAVSAAAPSSAAEQSSGRFRWPARGRVIAGYGRRPDGTHNDGINLALPQGTDVHASEAGKVAYAGNELKGYGNLILIRHDNGWVSAYAHNEQLLVRRDDVVQRGQVIAKAGKTGAVDQPQLHFELRQGSKPVDPLLHLEKN